MIIIQFPSLFSSPPLPVPLLFGCKQKFRAILLVAGLGGDKSVESLLLLGLSLDGLEDGGKVLDVLLGLGPLVLG